MSWLGSFAGGIAGNIVDSAFGRSNAKYSANLAYNNWVKQMSNAHQLEVADLRKAGLNPILSATNSQMAGIGSAPSITTGNTADNLTNASIARMQNKATLKGLEIEEKNADTELKKAETQKMLAESQAYALSKQAGYYETSSALQLAQRYQIEVDINHSIERHKFELDKLASETRYNNALTSQAYANIDLIRANIKFVQAETDVSEVTKKKIDSYLNDPKRMMNKEFWEKVKSSDDPAFVTIRASYQRGLVNDVLYNFYSDGSGSNLQNAESAARIAGQVKYVFTKGR